MRHAIEQGHFQAGLNFLIAPLSGDEFVPENLLESKHLCLDQTSSVVARAFFPRIFSAGIPYLVE